MQAKGILLPASVLMSFSSNYSDTNRFGFQLGANAILAVSLAVCKAGAAVKNLPLYKVF